MSDDDKQTDNQYQKLIEELFKDDSDTSSSSKANKKSSETLKGDEILHKHYNKNELLKDLLQKTLPRINNQRESDKFQSKIEEETNSELEKFKLSFQRKNPRLHKNLSKIFNDYFNS